MKINANEIIKELLARLYLSTIRSTDPDLWNFPLTESWATSHLVDSERLELRLGGEAKTLWDMVNESPYTPLETELLQRLQVVDYVHNKAEAGDFVDNWLAKAIYAPIEEITEEDTCGGFMLEHGLPWNRPWVWNSYKDQF